MKFDKIAGGLQAEKVLEASNKTEEVSGSCPAEIGDFKSSGDYQGRQRSWETRRNCGTAAWGNLYVGILSAHDLVNQDWFSKSDPYARFRLSDRHWREMRSSWVNNNKPVKVTRGMETEARTDNLNPRWKKTFAYEFLCPQIPFAPNSAPRGPKPPIVVEHLANQALNKGKSGHDFQLELTIIDADTLLDDSLGRLKLPVLDLMNGKYQGKNTFDLSEARDVQGTVDILLWYCGKGSDEQQCEDERAKEWKKHGVSTRVVKKTKFDCQMGLHTLLDPSRGRVAKYVARAKSVLAQAIGSASAAERFEKEEDQMDAASDAAAIAAFEAEHKEETKRLQEEWQKLEELEEAADRQGDLAQQDREKSWGQAVGLVKQLAALDGLGSQLGSASPRFGEVLRWVARPVHDYVYNAQVWYRLSGLYKQQEAETLMKKLGHLTRRLGQMEKCLKDRWFEEGKLLVNQWETTARCHHYFNFD